MTATPRHCFAALLLLAAGWLPLPVAAAIDAAKVEASCVRIFNFGPGGIGSGSGFVISRDGTIVTNEHVVNGAELLMVVHRTKGRTIVHEAKLIGQSTNQDLAVIRAPTLKAPVLSLSFSIPEKGGEEVYSCGYPGTADQGTAIRGFLQSVAQRAKDGDSSVDITQDIKDHPEIASLFEATVTDGKVKRVTPGHEGWDGASAAKIDLIEHSCDIQHGNSGGPLLNACGQVIAVVGRGLIKANGQTDLNTVQWAMTSSEVKKLLTGLNLSSSSATFCWGNRIYAAIAVAVSVMVAALLLVLLKSRSGRQKVSSFTTIVESRVRAALGKQQPQPAGAGGWAQPPALAGYPSPLLSDRTIPRPQQHQGTMVAGSWTLRGRTGDGRTINLALPGTLFSRHGNRIVLGRTVDLCHLPVSDSSVSRQHAQIRHSGGRFFVADRNSANGTLVNGHLCREPFKETAFAEGDTITLGDVKLVLERA